MSQGGIKIIIMNEKDDSDEECFIPAKWSEEQTIKNQILAFSVNSLLPEANNLHEISRPHQIHARTCFGELSMSTLPHSVDSGYCGIHPIDPCPEKAPTTSLSNFERREMEDFVSSYKLVYDKMSKYKQSTFVINEMSSRFKQIANISDYSKEVIKELKNLTFRKCSKVNSEDEFSSTFQCGNLGKVYKNPSAREYFLILENDVNSHGYTSWFFFKLCHTVRGTAKFHILNLAKKPVMYRMGMKIAVFSNNKSKQTGCNWFWGGENIQVHSNIFQKHNKPSESYYTLSFDYEFQEEDQVYFALTQPYTYSRVSKTIQVLSSNLTEAGLNVQVIKNVYSLSFNIIPIIEIKAGQEANFQTKKKSIILMARQHPAEVVGSFLMESIITVIQALGETIEQILSKFQIVLIPMVNPDGVIHGNSRCNLAGLDLNRQWNDGEMKKITPECQGLRKYIWGKLEDGGIQMVIDLHGHSKKLNSFFFCSKINGQGNNSNCFFSFLMSKIQPMFDFSFCTFSSTPDKKNTLRCQLESSKMPYCYTLQNSYFGYWQGSGPKPYERDDYNHLAKSLLQAIRYITFYKEKEIIRIISEKYQLCDENFANQMKKAYEKMNQPIGKFTNQKDMESESDPEGDILNEEEIQKIVFSSSIQKKCSEVRIRDCLTKKSKPRRKKSQIKEEKQKDDDLRKSHPAKQLTQAEKAKLSKSYKSEKKIILQSPHQKKNATQSKFYSRPRKDSQKIFVQRQEKMITTKNLTIGDKNKEISELKNKAVYSTVYKSGIGMQTEIRKSFRHRKEPSRHLSNQGIDFIRGNNSKMMVSLTKKAEESYKTTSQHLKCFLNETLSIQKVDPVASHPNQNAISQVLQKKRERPGFDSSFSHFGKNKTEGDDDKTFEAKKKFAGINFQKQLLKRKTKLMKKNQQGKYQRFQAFVSEHDSRNSSLRLESNSVFYYFPIL